MNRQLRRHPVHPFLLISHASKKSIVDNKRCKPYTKPKGFIKKSKRNGK